MPSRNVPPSQPPTYTPMQTLTLIQRQIERCSALEDLPYDDPKIDGWVSTTLNILEGAFGKPNGSDDRRTHEFKTAFGGPMRFNMGLDELQQGFLTKLANRKALLAAFLEQLNDSIPPAIATGVDQYRFHTAIEEVSGALLRDGHYKQAALEAYIRVIDEVKRRVAVPELDGERLMNRAFGSENQTPLLKLNSLQTDSERDEQKGIFLLFKGVVSLRNSKAHSNQLFDSPMRAHEYLALASLLMRLLEIAQA